MIKKKGWGSRLYTIWSSMHRRCKDVKNKYYGAKGISVCKSWGSFRCFEKWALNSGYEETLTLDRKRSNGNYKPSNCRWVTYKEQNNNRSTNTVLCVDGKRKTISQWSEIYGIGQCRISGRLRRGWSPEKAIKQPIDEKRISKCYR